VKEKRRIKSVPGSLTESLAALEKDHAFLTKGGVFSQELIKRYINYKKKNEIQKLAMKIHPFDFFLYNDA